MKPTNFRRHPRLKLIVLIFVLAAILFPGGEAPAAIIPGLYNTGVDNDGKKLTDGEPDSHYILTEMPGGVAPGTYAISDGSKPGLWIPSLGQSAWVGPLNGSENVSAGDYVYTLTFDLTGLIPSTAEIMGRWASDNASEIWLNGADTGNNRQNNGFLSLLDFTIASDDFIDGINSLEFRVNNLSSLQLNPSGLLVLDFVGTASIVPIPGAIYLFGFALITLLGIKRKLGG